MSSSGLPTALSPAASVLGTRTLAWAGAGSVGGPVGTAGGVVVGKFFEQEKKQRLKKRAQRVAVAVAAEEARQAMVHKFAMTLARIQKLKEQIGRELQRALYESEALGKHSVGLRDAPESEQFLQEIGQIQAVVSDLTAGLNQYEALALRGDEPPELLAELQPQADAALQNLSEIGRQAHAVWRKASLMAAQGADLLKALEQKRQAEEAARQAELARKAREASYADFQRRSEAERQRDVTWEASLQQRQEWMSRRRQALARGEPDPGTWAEQEGTVAGMSGWFSDLFGAAKKKEKEREKRGQRLRTAQAEAEKQARERAAIERRRQHLKLVMRDINAEAGALGGWVSRIRVLVNETPDLPAPLVDQAMSLLSQWESALEEVRAGVGELDLQTEDPAKQNAFMGELQAAMAAVRTMRIKAEGLRQAIESQVNLQKAHETKLDQLMTQQRGLEAREKALLAQAGESERALALEQQAARRQVAARVGAEQDRILAEERQRLAEELRLLRLLERRHGLLSRAM